jgi:hypothetical protein
MDCAKKSSETTSLIIGAALLFGSFYCQHGTREGSYQRLNRKYVSQGHIWGTTPPSTSPVIAEECSNSSKAFPHTFNQVCEELLTPGIAITFQIDTRVRGCQSYNKCFLFKASDRSGEF